MQIKILILTDNLAFWILTIKKCMNPITYSEGIDKYVIENELFRIEIKSQLRESRGHRYNAIVLDKYISDDALSKIVMPQMSICCTDCYFRDKEKDSCESNEKEKGKMTFKEFAETLTNDNILISNRYGKDIATWHRSRIDNQFCCKLELIFSEKILNSEVVYIKNWDKCLNVFIDIESDENE